MNGSYWLGAALGSLSTLIILDPQFLPARLGWRVGFATGAIVGLFILLLRRHVPESPRWLMTHGDEADAEEAMREIEARVERSTGETLPETRRMPLAIHPRKSFGFGVVAKTILLKYRARSVLSLSLIMSQAFLYNAGLLHLRADSDALL